MKERSPAVGRVFTAALSRFAKFGYEGTSLSHIADDIGIRKASLYTHFSSKDALFKEVFSDALAIEKAFVTQCFTLENERTQPGFMYCSGLAQRYRESDHMRLLVRVGYLPPAHLFDEINEAATDYLSVISGCYTNALRRWAASRGALPENDVAIFTQAYMGIVDGLHVKLVYTDGEELTVRLNALWRVLTDSLRLSGME